jgi:hypothetical protein
MKTYFKTLSATILLSTCIISNSLAQFGIKGGVSIANQKWTASGTTVTLDSKTGFHFGVISEIPMGQNFAFQPGILFTQKGLKMSSTLTGGNGDVSMTLNYIDIPLNFMVKVKAAESFKIFVATGPVIGYGISGKGESSSGSGDIKFGSDSNSDFKALDLNWGIGAGIELSQVQFSVCYNIGINDLSNTSSVTMKNNVINISMAILFGKKN